MKLNIQAQLDYWFDAPTDILLQVEAAHIPEQIVEQERLDLPPCDHIARMPAQDHIGERIWLRTQGRFIVNYSATVAIQRKVADCAALPKVPPHQLPGDTVQYLMPSCYCPSDRFQSFVWTEFGTLEDGAMIIAMRDWIFRKMNYAPGWSNSATSRHGICRDYAHLLITFARAAGIPARIASVYALGVDPPDFHAVAEVFLGNEWHLVDATGMAREGAMAKIGVGRDAADVAFLTSFGPATLNAQAVHVERAN
jgi:transglutaminase-like putative cysteine protease